MGVEAFTVIYDRQAYGPATDGTSQETTKTAAEALHGKFKEKVIIRGPVETAKIVEIEAEDEKQACVAARVLLGAKEAEGELKAAKVANIKKNTGR